ncbi:MAG: hypothetical protein M3128_03005 [Verrucomicrobiota bacterium]|nr:hypothetical protein [Verrucomicrobiota bacterium]
MNTNAIPYLNALRSEPLSNREGTERTRLLAAGSTDQLSSWRDWREGNFDLVLVGSWPNESLTTPDEP